MKKKLTKFFTNTFVGKIVDKTVFSGAVSSTVEPSVRTKEGKIDWKEIIVQLTVTALLLGAGYLFAIDKLSFSQLVTFIGKLI